MLLNIPVSKSLSNPEVKTQSDRKKEERCTLEIREEK